MIVAVDVHYEDDRATAAAVGFALWSDERAAVERLARVEGVEGYEPGQLYRRELPALLEVLRGLEGVEAVVVDGYVWLAPGRPGLGAHLHDALQLPVVGVAKTSFRGASAVEVRRGGSARPLFVTAVGVDAKVAAANVQAMHGPHRIPALLKRADALSRSR